MSPRRLPHFIVVSATDTGVGKTVLAALLTRAFIAQGKPAAALKPISSGGRQDARHMRAAAGYSLPLNSVNPWSFRAPIAPVLAAKREGKAIRLDQVLDYIRQTASGFAPVVIEGAGGLLSPLGNQFNTLDIAMALRSQLFIVVANKIGAVNQALMAARTLPRSMHRKTAIILMDCARSDASADSNSDLLRDWLHAAIKLHRLPRIPRWHSLSNSRAKQFLDPLLNA